MKTINALICRLSRVSAAVAGMLGLCLLPFSAQAVGTQQASGQLVTPASVLQVTGSQNKITIAASHADLLSALQLVFTQAHRQFVPDGGLTGEVTLALTDQTFATVLAAIDHQAFLRYDIDVNGIFHFHRDDRSLQEAFIRLRGMNALLRDQLQRMGYSVQYSLQGVPQAQLQSRQNRSQDLSVPGAPQNGSPQGQVEHAQAEGSTATQPATGRTATPDYEAAGAAKPGENGHGQQVGGVLTPYDQYVRSLGLVGVRAPRTQPMPVVDVLQQFSRQAGIPILIDPGIPNGLRFRFYGNIVRPLPEALNLLAAVAQLEWHEANGQIFITTTPDFKVFYGNSDTPGGVYPPSTSRDASGHKPHPAHPSDESGGKVRP